MFGIEAGAHAFRVTLHLVSESSDCNPALRKTVARWANNDWKRSALTTIDHEVIYTYCDDATVTRAAAEWDVDTSRMRDWGFPPAYAEWHTGARTTDCKLCGHKNNRFEFPLVNSVTGKEIWTGSTCIVKYGVTVDGDGCAETALATLRSKIAASKRRQSKAVWIDQNPEAPAMIKVLTAAKPFASRKYLPWGIRDARDDSGAQIWTRDLEVRRKRVGKWIRAVTKYYEKHGMLTPQRTASLDATTTLVADMLVAYKQAEARTPRALAEAEWTAFGAKYDKIMTPIERSMILRFGKQGYSRDRLYPHKLSQVVAIEKRATADCRPRKAADKAIQGALPW